MAVWVDDWDIGAPWLPWASYSDPIGASARAAARRSAKRPASWMTYTQDGRVQGASELPERR